MRDLVTAGVRTTVQVIVAAVVAWLLRLGIEVDAQALEGVLFAVATGLVSFLLNWLGRKFPIVNKIISLGLSGGGPGYSG